MDSGYKIINKNGNKTLLNLKDKIVSQIKNSHPNFNGDLSNLHKFVDQDKINTLRLKIFNFLNNKINWTKIIHNICFDDLARELGIDMLIQSKINLSIQMPNDETSVLSAHSDCWSSDSPFQINLWIPLTNAFDTNSMFMWNFNETLSLMKKIGKDKMYSLSPEKLKSKKSQFIKIEFGEILLFNPALIHGNVVNKTKNTRVSLNVRIKSLFSPEPTIQNADRKFGTYYKKFSISKNTSFGVKLVNAGIFNEEN